MQDPVREIAQIVQDLCYTSDPDVQKRTIERYFAEDAGFDHPLCSVRPGSESRKGIYGIYGWYKMLNPRNPPLEVGNIVFDEKLGRLYADIVQYFTIWLTPWRTTRMRLVVVLTLVRNDDTGLWLIKQQEDFYQPESIVPISIPGSYYAITMAKVAAGYWCGIGNRAGNLIGWWAPNDRSSPSEPHRKDL